MKIRSIVATGVVILCLLTGTRNTANAQNLTKEATNAFAMFTKSQDIKDLETARKHVDDAYKSAKDSLSHRTNLIRAMVYSALGVVDSNRNLSYTNDPLSEASISLKKLINEKFVLEHEPEIEFIKNQLSRGYLNQATSLLEYSSFEEAAEAFTQVDSLSPGNLAISHNLAILFEKLGYPKRAIPYYELLIEKEPSPAYYFSLCDLYSVLRDEYRAIAILKEGRVRFPKDRELVFREINYFAEKQAYGTVIELLPNALKLDENSISLNYLAGFSYGMLGNTAKAEEHYEKVLNSDPNNYDANYALGLLYLNSYVRNTKKSQFMYTASSYLSKANEIDPNQLKTLQSLAILYQYSGDEVQLQRVNNKINQLKLN